MNCDASAFSTYEALIGATQFLRVAADGGAIPGDTAHYLAQFDFPVEIRDAIPLTNDGDVYAADLLLTAVPDSTFGGYATATFQNLITAL